MKLLAIDGNSIINRAYYGIKLLSTKDGTFTNGIYGFLNILLKLMEDVNPDGVAVAFDMRAPTFRHEKYSEYKSGRKGMPDELASQLPLLKEILIYSGYTVLEQEGYEADDILGTLAVSCAQKGDECFIATGDRDTLQLVGDKVTVLLASTKMGRPVTTIYDTDKINEVYGLNPPQLIDVKALMGDSSDHIPGVSGIGEKTALALISRFGSLQAVYDDINSADIKDSVRRKLVSDKENAFMSFELGKIYTQVPVCKDVECYEIGKRDYAKLSSILTRLEMYKYMERVGIDPSGAEEFESLPKLEMTARICKNSDDLKKSLPSSSKICVVVQYEKEEITAAAVAVGAEILLVCGEAAKETLAAVMDSEITTHDAKHLIKALGEKVKIYFDTMLAGYLLNPSSTDYSLKKLAAEYSVTEPSVNGNPLYGAEEREEQLSFGDMTAYDPLIEYGQLISDAALLSAVTPRLKSEVSAQGMDRLLYEVEIPLSYVLADMETAGFAVDADGIKDYGEIISSEVDRLQNEIYGMVGYELNLNSPKQLSDALFVHLGLPGKKKTKSGYSTDAEVLESLKGYHPVIELLLSYRQVSKLKSTYCDGLLKVISDDGRIHSNFNQVETRTGRISSTEPNLQNIPVRQELGREMRKFFTAKEGYVLCDADYSQIELRVLADMADDKNMIEAFRTEADIHSITASQVFGVPQQMVTPLMRFRAKAVNFGIVYGIGAFSLSKDIGVSFAEAKAYIDAYNDTYSGVKAYMENAVEEAKSKGFATTAFGRRRYLPELKSSNNAMRSFGERVARNMPIQGTAADIIKVAMVKVYRRLRKEGLRSRLILQVHDELIVEAPKEEAEQAARILGEEMSSAYEMKVPLVADVHTGANWFEAKE